MCFYSICSPLLSITCKLDEPAFLIIRTELNMKVQTHIDYQVAPTYKIVHERQDHLLISPMLKGLTTIFRMLEPVLHEVVS